MTLESQTYIHILMNHSITLSSEKKTQYTKAETRNGETWGYRGVIIGHKETIFWAGKHKQSFTI